MLTRDELVRLAADFPEGALDDLVHELAQEARLGELNATDDPAAQEAAIAAGEREGSAVNNGGVGDQVDYLLAAGLGAGEVLDVLEGQR